MIYGPSSKNVTTPLYLNNMNTLDIRILDLQALRTTTMTVKNLRVDREGDHLHLIRILSRKLETHQKLETIWNITRSFDMSLRSPKVMVTAFHSISVTCGQEDHYFLTTCLGPLPEPEGRSSRRRESTTSNTRDRPAVGAPSARATRGNRGQVTKTVKETAPGTSPCYHSHTTLTETHLDCLYETFLLEQKTMDPLN